MVEHETQSQWRRILDELVIGVQPVSAPEGKPGTWHQTLTRFARTGFLRVLVSPSEDEARNTLDVHVQFALGDAASFRDRALLDQIIGVLAERSHSPWKVLSEDLPWEVETTISFAKDEDADYLRKAFISLMKIADHVRADEPPSATDLLAALGVEAPHPPASAASAAPASGGAAAASTADRPTDTFFEPIGLGESASSTSPGSARVMGRATMKSHQTAVHADHIEVTLLIDEVLSPLEIARLTEALAHHLRVKFDVDATALDSPDRADRQMAHPHDSELFLRVATSPDQARSIESALGAYFDKLKEFERLGIDLFDVLGAREAAPEPLRGTSGAAVTIRADHRVTAPSPRERAADQDEVVFDLSGAGGARAEAGFPDETVLRPGEFTDPRLKREDATTPLVDVVLRHPGYSDRRIGQVLSILLSIEYHNALRLAEGAPCVIAWGIGVERARSFKEVIESAGGKVLLVAPGEFGEQ